MHMDDSSSDDDGFDEIGSDASATPEPNSEDRNADRRELRSRKSLLKRLMKQHDLDPRTSQRIINDLASLMPPRHRMSTKDDLYARLVGMVERDTKTPHSLNMKRLKLALDVQSETTPKANDKLAELVKSDEDLLAAFVANERLRGVLELQLAEHDATRRTLIAMLGSRYTLAEQWRYKVPKFLLPLVAVMLRAGVSRDDIDNGRWLLSEIIKLLLAQSDNKNLPQGLTKEQLQEAAANVELQFEALVPEVLEGPSSPFLQEIKFEKLNQTQERLKGIVRNLRQNTVRTKDPEEREKRKQLWWSADLLHVMGGGIDDLGRPVFGSIEGFREALEHLINVGILARGDHYGPPDI